MGNVCCSLHLPLELHPLTFSVGCFSATHCVSDRQTVSSTKEDLTSLKMKVFWSVYFLGRILLALQECQHCVFAHNTEFNETLYATCLLKPQVSPASGMPKVYGMILFRQESLQSTLSVRLQLSGFDKMETASKAVHIHQFGDLSMGCTSTGGHYDPHNVDHPNHPGDFGNFVTQSGRIRATIQSNATLFGGDSVIGRAVVVHAQQDDLGRGGNAASLKNGNAGSRIGCCVIGISSPDPWNKPNKAPKTIRKPQGN